MPMYNLIEYIDAYLNTKGSVQQYYRDEPALGNKNIIDFLASNNNSISFKYNQQIAGQKGNGGKENVEIMDI